MSSLPKEISKSFIYGEIRVGEICTRFAQVWPRTLQTCQSAGHKPWHGTGSWRARGVGAGRGREVRRTQRQLLPGTGRRNTQIVAGSAFSSPTCVCAGEDVAAWAASAPSTDVNRKRPG